jgi:hypothetical protein
MQEKGGLNLYFNSGNDLVTRYDLLGLLPWFYSHACKEGPIIKTLTAWAVVEFGPGDTPGGDLGEKFSNTIDIVYKETVTQVFICPCGCPSTNTYDVPRYSVASGIGPTIGHADFGWAAIPLPIDIPAGLEEALLSLGLEFGSNLAGDVLTPNDIAMVHTLENENLPAPGTAGILLKKDIPTRRCWQWW